MRIRSKAAILLALVLPAISCSRGPKYEFPLVQKYTSQAGDVFYFRPRDGQFVLVERRKALAVAIAPEPNIEAFSYDDRITVSRAMPEGGPQGKPQGEMLENRTLLLFTASITLFHFANAAMLPLVGEKLALSNQETSSLFMASCIISAQMVMIPMAILVGHKADTWGRKPIFLLGFAVLPLRGVLYTLTQDPHALVAIQLLDGVGAGIFGALFFIVVADLTRGTGRYNLALGASGACWGLGAALSNGVAGFIVNAFGFSAAVLIGFSFVLRRILRAMAELGGEA